ncbi:MAG: DUF2807 domain-containing protein [Armatimonadetes bacterium]|uniref:Putative auto-transporter adhesin head GIN domain-containing protein n=1 Tax=Candidatus Nitrosymbiomonas proteolyticus TaxID=2608984 RepID=A0A809RV26_9BACT|nr:DUF2807 domain-containing protein [Armatimonadota bacterium]BBO23662.1 conserved hypothetical protein [Candidatus Nitrosymbiomonas proteolyticus]
MKVFVLFLSAWALGGCMIIQKGLTGRDTVLGSGKASSVSREGLGEFRSIELSLPAEVSVKVGDAYSVTLHGDDNLLARVRTEVEGGELEIGSDANLRSKTGLRIEITVPRLEGASIAGSGSIDAEIGTVDAFRASVAGSGELRAEGIAKSVAVSIAGSGDVNLDNVASEDAEVEIAGSGDVTVKASKNLKIEIAGSGSVKYVGDPKVQSSVAGSGDVAKIG